MTYEGYRLLYLGGAGLAALMFLVTVVLFFVLKIPSVIGDLTGATAKKAIKRIDFQNGGHAIRAEKTGALQSGSNSKGKRTKASAPARARETVPIPIRTEKIETEVLLQRAQEAWEPPSENETTLLQQEGGELGGYPETGYINETTVLGQPMPEPFPAAAPEPVPQQFEVLFDITFLPSDVMIP